MGKKAASSIIMVVTTFFLLALYSQDFKETAAQTSPTPTITSVPACVGHSGVNCSVINPDALATCNDGTIDPVFSVYMVPECHPVIQAKDKIQANIMISTGCHPPSEMTCIDQQSYNNLSAHLTRQGVSNSELGKNELATCNQQIQNYKAKNDDYKQCLAENENLQLNLSAGRTALPFLKTIFCPVLYGENSYFDSELNLCVCNSGHFMSGGSCTDANSICQAKYGPGTRADKGNCVCGSGYKLNADKSLCISTGEQVSGPVNPSPVGFLPNNPINDERPVPTIIPTGSIAVSPTSPPEQEENGSKNLIVRIFSKIFSDIMSIFR